MGTPTIVSSPRQTSPAPTPPPAPDLSLSKVLAVAGAGATSAVLGSLFGVAGTVLGAAIGAVASTIATSLYQRSLERARSAVSSRIRKGDPEATVVLAPPVILDEPSTVRIAPVVERTSRRRIVGYVVATVLGFALALGAVTAVEALKGSTLLGGESGTSVGRVIQGGGSTATTTTPAPSDEPTTSSDANDDDDSGSAQYDHNNGNGPDDSDSASASASAKPSVEPSSTPSATSQPGLGTLLGGGTSN